MRGRTTRIDKSLYDAIEDLQKRCNENIKDMRKRISFRRASRVLAEEYYWTKKHKEEDEWIFPNIGR